MKSSWYHTLLNIFCLVCTVSMTIQAKKKDLQIITVSQPEDCWQAADIGDEVTVHYTGTLETGTVFDTSLQPNRGPLPFILGEGKVIQGWERGIKGMCIGEKRKLIIPPHLAYGKNGYPPTIPPDATLTFETELVSLRKKSIDETIIPILRFLSLPVAVGIAVYYIYGKYKEAPTKKELKEERRSKKKRH